MSPQKIFYFLFVAITPLAYSKHVPMWDQRVFPDDLEWFPSPKRHATFDSVENTVDTNSFTVCETPECKKVAEEFLSSMNKSIDPCEDFYEFSCGGWASKNPIPPSSPVWSRFMIFQNTVQSRIRDLLETEIEPADILPVKQAKKWYRSCMDIETLERRGIKPIESIMLEAGGWPISMDAEEWDSEEYNWHQVDRHYARLTGSYSFYEIHTNPPDDGSSFGEFLIAPANIPLTDELPLKYRNYTGNDYKAYIRLVEGVADLFVQHNRADVSKEKVRKEAEEIVEFEKQIYKLSSERSEFVSPPLEEFIEWYETNVTDQSSDPKLDIDWESGIQFLFDMVNINVDPSTETSTWLGFIKKLSKLLTKTPQRTIVNYIHWKFVANMLPYTIEQMRDELFMLVSEEYGVKERPPRWSECVSDMKMSHAAAYMFVNKFYPKTTETSAMTMINNIRIEMEAKIENSNWLDETSKEWAKDKLNRMKIFVGFPDWYKNKTAVINYYKGLVIGAEYFDNILSFMRYESKQNLKSFATPMEKTDGENWHIDPITVNALNVLEDNVVNVPASDLQAPLFTPKLPNNVNYGIAGVIVGHEISHGFDDSGIQFGVDGLESNLSKNMRISYVQRADCFLDQFSEYYGENNAPESEGVTSKPKELKSMMSLLTRGENIADTTGVQAVFQAYQNQKKSGNELKLPGLEDFTDEQLFFFSFSAMWCKVETPQYQEKEKESRDEHSPARLRVIGAISNTEDFAKAFNCPVGSPMNPSNKCNIWEKPEIAKTFKSMRTRKSHHHWMDQWS